MIFELYRDGVRAAFMNVDGNVIKFMYTEPNCRRLGYMTELFYYAKEQLPDIVFSENISNDGKLFIESLEGIV